MANVLVTLLVMPILLFLAFAVVPFFIYAMKSNHLSMLANHTLKEVEAVGYLSPDMTVRLNERLRLLGLDSVEVSGTMYPSYAGSTAARVLRDDPDPTVRLVVKYPAPNMTRMLQAVGGKGGANSQEGFYYLELFGRSEAYE